MQSGLFSSRLTLRIFCKTATLRSCVLWEKLRRTTSTPARIMARMTGSVFEAGPRVATILARRCDGDSVRLRSAKGMEAAPNSVVIWRKVILSGEKWARGRDCFYCNWPGGESREQGNEGSRERGTKGLGRFELQ